MWVRKRIDIGWSDLAAGLLRSIVPPKRQAICQEVEAAWSPDGDALACLSVRSGFDLLLDVLELPPGSEILVSALTIPDMVRIIEHHGLVPVPVDVDAERMEPRLDALKQAVTPATRAVLVAHLFGTRIRMEPIVEVAQRHNLLLLEDCAQAFAGDDYRGDPRADVSMFSFGPIKTATALGGALLRVRDDDLRDKMRRQQSRYPLQETGSYFRRLLKYSAMKVGATRPVLGAIVWLWRALGRDVDLMINGTARGFPGPSFFEMIRHQPSASLLALLRRRLRTFNRQRLARRVERGNYLIRHFDGQVCCPGVKASPHSHWVFPVMVDDPLRVLESLCAEGFDATQGQSMCVVQPPEGRSQLHARGAEQILEKTVYLPFYPEMPERAFRRMADLVLETCGPMVDPIGEAATDTAAASGGAVRTKRPVPAEISEVGAARETSSSAGS